MRARWTTLGASRKLRRSMTTAAPPASAAHGYKPRPFAAVLRVGPAFCLLFGPAAVRISATQIGAFLRTRSLGVWPSGEVALSPIRRTAACTVARHGAGRRDTRAAYSFRDTESVACQHRREPGSGPLDCLFSVASNVFRFCPGQADGGRQCHVLLVSILSPFLMHPAPL